MKKIFLFIISFLLTLVLSSCTKSNANETINVSLSDDFPEKIVVGDQIDFRSFIETENENLDVSLEYSIDNKENYIKYHSLYFEVTNIGTYNFKLIFTMGEKVTEIERDVVSVAEAPTITESNSAIYVQNNTVVSFEDLIDSSSIIVLPIGYVDFKFLSVNFEEDYKESLIKIEGYAKGESYKRNIEESENSFNFDKPGKYLFDILFYNSEGQEETTLQVSVKESDDVINPDSMTSSGAIFGRDNNCVELMMSSSSTELSYLGYQNKVSLNNGEFISLSTVFNGKNAPQILAFSDTLDGDVVFGNGYLISIEYPKTSNMSVIGPKRESSSVVCYRNTFSRDTLKDDKTYKWTIIIGVSTKGDQYLIKSTLEEVLETGFKTVGTFNWLSFDKTTEADGYFSFIGSTYSDIIFEYSEITPYVK